MGRFIPPRRPILIDGTDEVDGTLTVERDVETFVSTSRRRDPDWRYTDAAGHTHRYDDGYPTLVEVIARAYWCHDCRDVHEETALTCRDCGEHIVPGTLPPSPLPRQFVTSQTWEMVIDRVYERGTEHLVELPDGWVGRAVVTSVTSQGRPFAPPEIRTTMVGLGPLTKGGEVDV